MSRSGLVVWVVAVVVGLLAVVFFPEGGLLKQDNSPVVGSSDVVEAQVGTRVAGGSGVGGEVLSAEVVSLHDSQEDCWMIIDGSVYDVTGFISEHPGGAGEIVTRCGEDASDAFVTKGGKGKDHSAFAYELLAKYFIGRVGDVASDGQSERGAASGGGSSKAGEAGGSGLNVAVPDRQDEDVKEVENVKAPSADVSSGGVSGSVASDVSCTEEEVSLHASKDDCWMIIDGKVYDITAFFRKHPGGDKNLLKGCGLDASRLYDGSAGPHKHSAAARALLDDFFLCTVGGSAPVGGAAGSSSRSSSSSAPSSSSQESPSGGDDCGSVEDCVVEDALRRFPSCNFKKVEREDWGFNVVLKCGEEVKVKYDRSGRFLEVDD